MVKAVFEQVLIQPLEGEEIKTESGLYVGTTDSKEQEIVKGLVVGLGEETKYIRKGDIVFYDKYVARKIIDNNEKRHCINRKEIIATNV